MSLNQLLTAAAIGSLALPLMLVLWLPAQRRLFGFGLWLAAPPVAYVAALVVEAVSRPQGGIPLTDALLGFSLLSAFLLLPWLLLSAIGAAIGVILKKLLRR